MPVNWNRYPKDWKAIALKVKEDANWNCEECGRPCRKPGVSWEGFVISLNPDTNWDWYSQTYEESEDGEIIEKSQRFTLTVAHIDHDPMNCDRANLKALCSGCHLRFDAKLHAKNAAATRARKKEQQGQLTLL